MRAGANGFQGSSWWRPHWGDSRSKGMLEARFPQAVWERGFLTPASGGRGGTRMSLLPRSVFVWKSGFWKRRGGLRPPTPPGRRQENRRSQSATRKSPLQSPLQTAGNPGPELVSFRFGIEPHEEQGGFRLGIGRRPGRCRVRLGQTDRPGPGSRALTCPSSCWGREPWKPRLWPSGPRLSGWPAGG